MRGVFLTYALLNIVELNIQLGLGELSCLLYKDCMFFQHYFSILAISLATLPNLNVM